MMHIPKNFEVKDTSRIISFLEENSFATLITNEQEEISATNLPLVVERSGAAGFCVYGHIARNNPQVNSVLGHKKALAIFQGAHGYISPRWYENKQVVPTWNYMTAHIDCVLKPIEDTMSALRILELTTQKYETGPNAWKIKDQWGLVTNMVGHILSFELVQMTVTAKFKLGQNRAPADIQKMLAAMEQLGDHNYNALARELRSLIS